MPEAEVRTKRLVAGVVLGGLAAVGLLWVKFIQPASAHGEWRDRVTTVLRAMRDKQPAGVSDTRWECICLWTWNLHGNCAGFGFTNLPEREWTERFVVELERRAAGPLTLADIDWIWDEYSAHTQLGQKYSDSYRPTRCDVCPEK